MEQNFVKGLFTLEDLLDYFLITTSICMFVLSLAGTTRHFQDNVFCFHTQIRYYGVKIVVVVLKQSKGFCTALGRDDIIPIVLKDQLEGVQDALLIIDDKQTRLRTHSDSRDYDQ